MTCSKLIALLLSLVLLLPIAMGQATITEEQRGLTTYPFDDPNPIPILTDNAKIYPYFKYEGYAQKGVEKQWKVVTLENEFIQVFVLPEAGGKVWGAIEKSTGEEFIYRNEVMKFRNIAMRGPWTSGGIEFNFGIIGHTPSTATPVDYILQSHDDGSVTCVVGNMDLPSRNHWRVFITLPPDKAYFETRVVWYNPSPFNHTYYNWMTAAAATGNDLEFFIPGNQYLTHPGQAKSWPYDGDRKISDYARNNYGPSKSYHIVGSYDDFFGGYFHDSKVGFGHWARYDDMPGQKLWLWALSRSGGIWEDLLTDTDGQYIEFQAGRQFNQYSPGADRNPITKTPFEPYRTDEWSEIWFPVKDIRGLTEVSKSGVLHIVNDNGTLEIGVNALQNAEGTVTVHADGTKLFEEQLDLPPMGVFEANVTLPKGTNNFIVDLPEMDLKFNSDPLSKTIKRPFASYEAPAENSAQFTYEAAMEWIEDRDFTKGHAMLEKALAIDPQHTPSHLAMAELMTRRAQYNLALQHVYRVLGQDTYHPQANFLAGTIYRAQGEVIDALESFGWSARAMAFRSASYTQMAELQISLAAFDEAKHYAQRALDYNRFNISAWKARIVAQRKLGEVSAAEASVKELLAIDPLNHFGHHEQALLGDAETNWDQYIRNELPAQHYLELAIDYFNLGLTEESMKVLATTPTQPLVELWKAYLQKHMNADYEAALSSALSMPTAFVHPFRREVLPVLQWALEQRDHWKLKYYLGLAYWGKDRSEEASQMMEACGQEPNHYAFYIARAELREQLNTNNPQTDLEKASELAPQEWRTADKLIGYYQKTNQHSSALSASKKAFQAFPQNNSIAFKCVKALLQDGQPQAASKTLDNLQVLPFEGASEGRRLYENTWLMLAAKALSKGDTRRALSHLEKARQWPEHLGVGKPYDPDHRAIDFFEAVIRKKAGQDAKAKAAWRKVLDYPGASTGHPNYLVELHAAKSLDDKKALQALIEQGRSSDDSVTEWALQVFEGRAPQMSRENVQMQILRSVL